MNPFLISQNFQKLRLTHHWVMTRHDRHSLKLSSLAERYDKHHQAPDASSKPGSKACTNFLRLTEKFVGLGGVDTNSNNLGRNDYLTGISTPSVWIHFVEINPSASFGQILGFCTVGHSPTSKFCCQRANKLCPSAIPRVLDSALLPGRCVMSTGFFLSLLLDLQISKRWACLAISAPSSKACS